MAIYLLTDNEPSGAGGAPTEGAFHINYPGTKRTALLFAARSALTYVIDPTGAILVQGRPVGPDAGSQPIPWIDIAHINTADWSAADGNLVACVPFTPMANMRGGWKNTSGAGTLRLWVYIPD